MHGLETADRGRDAGLPGWFEGFTRAGVDGARRQLAGRDAGLADLALRRPGIVFERMKHDRALRTDEQCGKKKAWQ